MSEHILISLFTGTKNNKLYIDVYKRQFLDITPSPFVWSICSCVTNIASISLRLKPAVLSPSSILFLLIPASKRTCVSSVPR